MRSFFNKLLTIFPLSLFMILCASSLVAASSQQNEPAWQQRAFNYGILQTDKDAEVYLALLTQLQRGEQQKAMAFMDYQLDEIVCGLWVNMDDMNDAQKSLSMKRLRTIKAYRQQYPREQVKVETKEFSHYVPEQDSSMSARADAILNSL